MARKGLLLALVLAAASAAVLAYRLVGGGEAAAQRVAVSEDDDTTPRAAINLDLRRRQLIGVRTARAERRRSAIDIRATGTVTFDETRNVDVSARIAGWVRDLKANATGITVQKGDPLFTLRSPDLLAAETAFVDALRERDHTTELTTPTLSPMTNLPMTPSEARDHVERMIDAARTRLLLLDLTVPEVRELERRGRGLGVMTVLAPSSGTIVQKDVIEGMYAEAGQRLFRLADLASVWVEAEIPESDVASIRAGQMADVTLRAFAGETLRARIAYVYPAVSEQSRTVRVRLALPNPGRRLKPGMFAAVAIEGAGRMALTVPLDAVVDTGREQLVFLAEGDGYFQPRPVKTGQRFGDAIEIVEGLAEGQTIAGGATFFLDSESQLRGALQNYAAPAGDRLQIVLRTDPDPPQAGTTTFEVSVRDANGRAIPDAEVSAMLFMPAMPSMSMPAMRSDVMLSPAGDGTYRGAAQVTMAGRWDVTIRVRRGGETLGSRQLSLVAR